MDQNRLLSFNKMTLVPASGSRSQVHDSQRCEGIQIGQVFKSRRRAFFIETLDFGPANNLMKCTLRHAHVSLFFTSLW